MKTHNKIILSMLGSAFLAGTVSAQNWTVNGTTQPLPLTTSSEQSAVAIDPLTGVASVRTAAPAGTPAVSISAVPTSVNVNGATTVAWSTSGFTGAINCTRTSSPVLSGASGWSGSSSVASGSVSVTMPSTQQTVTLTLSCTASNGTASNFTNVVVTSDNTVNCLARPPGVSGAPGVPASSRILVNRPFTSIWGTDFPGSFGPTIITSITDGTVIAYAFVAPFNNTIEGYFQTVPTPQASGLGTAATSISECPGDISNAVPTCEPSFGKTRNEWTTNGRLGACNLIPGRQYYYNLSILGSCTFVGIGTPGATCAFGIEAKRIN